MTLGRRFFLPFPTALWYFYVSSRFLLIFLWFVLLWCLRQIPPRLGCLSHGWESPDLPCLTHGSHFTFSTPYISHSFTCATGWKGLFEMVYQLLEGVIKTWEKPHLTVCTRDACRMAAKRAGAGRIGNLPSRSSVAAILSQQLQLTTGPSTRKCCRLEKVKYMPSITPVRCLELYKSTWINYTTISLW